MDSTATILATHASNDSMWDKTDTDNIGSLVNKDNPICCHLLVTPFKELEEECCDMSELDDMVEEPIVETVEEVFLTLY